jgi:DNA-binding MarR family transcriptional regulator
MAPLLCVASTIRNVIDGESVRPLDESEEDVIRALLRAVLVLPRLLDADLVREQRLALAEYEVLRHLSEAPRRLLRMSELAARCQMSLSGTTRLAARLESEGLLKRVTCEQDGRGTNAVLTYAGLKRLQAAWPAHLASVRRHVVDHLGALDLASLALALHRVGTSADPPVSSVLS